MGYAYVTHWHCYSSQIQSALLNFTLSHKISFDVVIVTVIVTNNLTVLNKVVVYEDYLVYNVVYDSNQVKDRIVFFYHLKPSFVIFYSLVCL